MRAATARRTPRQREALMRDIRIGCYGTNGHQILGLAPALKGASIDAVAGVSEAEFDRIAKDHPNLAGSLKHYPDLEALLADDRLAMVSLCSPRRDRQAEETVRALGASKHDSLVKTLRRSECLVCHTTYSVCLVCLGQYIAALKCAESLNLFKMGFVRRSQSWPIPP